MAEFDNEDKLSLPKQILEMGPSYFKYILMKPTQRRISYMSAIFLTALRLTMVVLALRLLPEAKSLMVIIDVIASASAFTQVTPNLNLHNITSHNLKMCINLRG